MTSGYQAVQQEFIKSGVQVPVMFSEFGCNQWDFLSGYPWTSNSRQWMQVPTIFDPQQMASSFSGGIAYTLIMAANAKAARVKLLGHHALVHNLSQHLSCALIKPPSAYNTVLVISGISSNALVSFPVFYPI